MKFGWQKDPYDKRDYLHAVSPTLEPFPNNSNLIPYIRHQGNEGSCVGHGEGAVLTGEAKRQGIFTEWFSPRWIYNGARFISGLLNRDEGCYPRDGWQWLKDKGCLLEKYWIYLAGVDTYKSPPSSFDTFAQEFPLIEYYRITNGINGICSALQSGYLVSIGNPWFEKWLNPEGGILPHVERFDPIVGGHETYIYAADRAKGIFYGGNSWGHDWGGKSLSQSITTKGFYQMEFDAIDVFKERGGYDAHYVKVNWGMEQPEPAPITKIQLLINGIEEFTKEV